MSVEIAWKQNILVTDFQLLKSLLVVLGFGSQAFVRGFSRQNINSVSIRISIPNLQIIKCTLLDPTLFEEYIVYTSLHISIAVAEVTDMLQGRSICSCDQFCLTTKQNTFFFSSNSWQGGGLARAL